VNCVNISPNGDSLVSAHLDRGIRCVIAAAARRTVLA
jgi:hypothetical protein